MKTIVIEVQGGVVQEVYTDEEIRVVLVDWDEQDETPDACASHFTPTSLALMPDETEEQVERLNTRKRV